MADKFDPKRNLIVNYIPNSLTQDDVKEMFERIGTVSSCKLIVNKMTGTSQGYAFVEYAEETSAQRAIDEITGTEILGKTLKVSLAVKPDATTEAKNANVYIAGLPPTVTDNDLLSYFSPYGSVLSHKLLTHPNGTSRGAGFVRFANNTDADLAIKEMNGKILTGSTVGLTVKMAIPPAAKQDTQSLRMITNSTLNGIGVASRTANVRYNPMMPSNSIVAGNYAAAKSSPASAVAAAMSGLNSHIAQNGGGMGGMAATQVPVQPASVYVFGLAPTHSELTLYELFSPFGGILNVKLIRDLTKEEKPCKGYGFVNFTNMNDAVRAVTSMNGVQFEDKVLQVSFKQNKNQVQMPTQLPQSYTTPGYAMGMQGMGLSIAQH